MHKYTIAERQETDGNLKVKVVETYNDGTKNGQLSTRSAARFQSLILITAPHGEVSSAFIDKLFQLKRIFNALYLRAESGIYLHPLLHLRTAVDDGRVVTVADQLSDS